jgi:hypothetical protein
MEPIAEEKSELAMEIAQAVVEKLDIDRKLDERMRELMLRGDRIFREIQVRQEQSVDALSRSVVMCLESQRTFHEEHQRLLSTVKQLAGMVAPCSPYGLQAVEAHARAAALAEETEVLKKQMETAGSAVAAATTCAAAIATTAAAPVTTPAPAAAPTTFNITLRKADDTSLGLSVTANEDSKVLIVEGVVAGGAVESWNRQCCGDADRVVVAGDRIMRVNGIESDVQKMLEECTTQRLVKLTISRGPGGTRARTAAAQKQAKVEAAETEPSQKRVSTLRMKAPEFVPMGVDAAPLTQTQHLAAPPGLFLRNDESSAGQILQTACGNENLKTGSVEAALQTQDCTIDDEDSDKEN